MPCDDDWQSEGRRIVAALQHSHPITAYTRIADEVAESLLNESNEMPFEGSKEYFFVSLVMSAAAG